MLTRLVESVMDVFFRPNIEMGKNAVLLTKPMRELLELVLMLVASLAQQGMVELLQLKVPTMMTIG